MGTRQLLALLQLGDLGGQFFIDFPVVLASLLEAHDEVVHLVIDRPRG